VICDELSQLPTREAAVVLAVTSACVGGQVWFVGDPQQAQPVGAGGLAHYLTADPDRPDMVTAALTVSRRQVDPDERAALSAYRAGRIDHSQTLRDQRGWEQNPGGAEQARRDMANAVVADVGQHGAQQVMALAGTHADCEALADRIRVALTADGRIVGPSLQGPGWAVPREYRAGDRIVLHAHLPLPDRDRLTNGTTATITAVGPDGLVVTPDGREEQATIPDSFVQERSVDGRPHLSHAWCRTIDGVQGGTWTQVHLLATPALDHYRGYVGQSRSMQPTHTWNTIPAPDPDHGGRLVGDPGTPAEQVATAMHRAHPKTFAAIDDPHRIHRRYDQELAQHRRALAQRPPDPTQELDAARSALQRTEASAAEARRFAERCEAEVATSRTGLRRLTPGGRSQRADAEARLAHAHREVDALEQRYTAQAARFAELDAAQQQRDRRGRTNAWRADRITDLQRQIKDHWADAVLDAARSGHPHAYGTSRLRGAHQHLAAKVKEAERGDQSSREERADLLDLERAIREANKATQADRPNPRRAVNTGPDPTIEPVGAQRGIGPEL
jgi:AAA domain